MSLERILALKNSAQLENKANIEQEAWITPTLQNSWVNDTATWIPLKYYKDTLGVVWVNGRIINGAVSGSSVAFILPEGYRPTAQFAVYDNSNCILVRANGEVITYSGASPFNLRFAFRV